MSSEPAEKPKKRVRNPEITRNKLLQAAVDLISEKGPEALSLKEAALRADVSRSATYIHFKDRDHLLQEAKTWITRQLQEGVTRFEEGVPLYDRVFYTTHVILQNPEISRAMMVDALTRGELNAKHPLYKQVRNRLRDLQRKGTLASDVDLEVRTYIHLGQIAATLLWQKQHEDEDPKKLAERFAREWTRTLQEQMIEE
jgi:AcrR family transcriptional regulator